MELIVTDIELPGLVDGDLIALRGPDSNWLTRRLDDAQPGSTRFGNPERNEITMTDLVTDRYYAPKGGGRDPVTVDVGIIKRLTNPFARDRHTAAGSYGYGTWAAPVSMRTRAFLDHPVVRSGVPFECLFTVPVVAGRPEGARIEAVYPMRADADQQEAHAAFNEGHEHRRPPKG